MRTLRILCATLSLTIPAISQTPAPKPISALPPGGFTFAGAFDCAGTFRGGKTHRAAFTAATILEGKWLELTEQDIEPATGYLAKYLIGYDSEHNRLVEFDANNFGAATYSSPDGWQQSVLTMTSPISTDPKAPYVANRFLYSITGKDAFTVDWQIAKDSTLAWIPADHLLCKRSTHA